MFHVVERINGGVLWANLHLLFWLSLLPFTTAWMDETRLRASPTVVYGVDLLFAAIAYYLLELRDLRGPSGPRLRDGARPRPQGQAVAGDVHHRHPAGVRQPWLALGRSSSWP